MTVTTLWERIAGKQLQRRQQRIDGYRELVAKIAAGQEPDAEQVETTLANAGKSLDDLRQAVELDQKRTTLKSMVASMPKLEAERQEVQQQISKADDDLAEAEQRHNDVTAPLYAQLQQLKEALSDAETAKRELFRTSDNPQLRRLLDENSAEAEKLHRRQADLRRQAADLDNQAQIALHHAGREFSLGDTDHRREQAATFQNRAAAVRLAIQAIDKNLATLAKRREEIEQQMRDA